MNFKLLYIIMVFSSFAFSQEIVWTDSTKSLVLSYKSEVSEDRIYVVFFIDSLNIVQSIQFRKVFVEEKLTKTTTASFEDFIKKILKRKEHPNAIIVKKEEEIYLITCSNHDNEDKNNYQNRIQFGFKLDTTSDKFYYLKLFNNLEDYYFESYRFL